MSELVKEYNCETGETIEREMTADEFAQHQIEQAAYQAKIAAQELKNTARQAVLARLGLTEEEAQLIIGGSN
jgi:hypothetical protein